MKTTLLIIILLLLTPTAVWEKVAKEGPGPRYVNQLVYAKDRLILVGGKHSDNKGYDDVWEWKDGQWRSLGNGCGKRWDHSVVYIDHLDQVFVFGGRTFKEMGGKEERVELGDNWVYKADQWKKLTPPGPEARSSHSMAYDQHRKKVVLFGGRQKEKHFADTWLFDGKQWQQLNIPGPSKRFGHSMTYDPVSKKVYLFGGKSGETLLNDLWAFDGESWKEIVVSERPPARMAHAMKFDHKGNAVMFGGWDQTNAVPGKLWWWSEGRWERLLPKKMPAARLSGAIGYDRAKETFVLFGGSTGFGGTFPGDTWELHLD